ncbi:hypothetical protein NE237_020610 [Protea cynaroides]|uniref:Vacuolar iron transporter n=1 Tax=Protea cynaroides TaxID=273540 RepID=A0A9Q0H9Q4_9MAGN|nr:hypothetical protein NE237_020610 [Protea cynaroides]
MRVREERMVSFGRKPRGMEKRKRERRNRKKRVEEGNTSTGVFHVLWRKGSIGSMIYQTNINWNHIPSLVGSFIPEEKLRIRVVVGVTSIALILSGIGGARMGRLPIRGSILRIFFSGLLAMVVTYGVIFFVS